MATGEPNWKDIYEKAKASADADFDREFEEAMKEATAKNSSKNENKNENEDSFKSGTEQNQETSQTENQNENENDVESEKIARMREEMEKARREFAEMEYKKKTMWGSVRSFFGRQKIEKTEREIEGKPGEYADVLNDEDVTYMRALYDNKIFDYKNALFDQIKSKGLEGAELEKAIKDAASEITSLERCAAYNAKTEIKEENMKGTDLEVIKSGWQKSVDWYRKLPRETQKLITIGLWAGAGAATLASAGGMASIFAGLGLTKRFLAGSSIGITSYAGMNKIADKSRNWRDSKNAEKISRKYEDLSLEERVERIKKDLTKDVLEVNDKVDSREYWDTFRMSGAAVFGATIGSGVFAHWLSDQFGIGEKVHGIMNSAIKSEIGQRLMEMMGIEGYHLGGASSDAIHNGTSNVKSDTHFDPSKVDQRYSAYGQPSVNNGGFMPSPNAFENGGQVHGGFTPSTNAYEHSLNEAARSAAELPKETFTLHEGSNFIATLKHDFLESHREEFLKMHPEMAKFNNDQIAFRLAKMYGDKYNEGHLPDFVKAGAKMTFDPKTMEVHFLNRNDVGWFETVNTEVPVDAETPEIEAPGTAGEIPPVKSTEDIVNDAINQHEQNEFGLKQKIVSEAHENFVNADKDYVKAADAAMNHAPHDGPSVQQYEAMGEADKIRTGSAETIERITNAQEVYLGDVKKATMDIYKSTGYRWDDVKDLDYSAAHADDKLEPIITKIEKDFRKEFGQRIFPKNDETFGRWLYRVKKLAIKKRLGIDT